MAERALKIPYPEQLLLSLKESPEQFESEARLLLAVKLFETGRISSGMAARLAGLPRVVFLLRLGEHGVSCFGSEAGELAQDAANA
jgi:predicted HTH domain antitoxin